MSVKSPLGLVLYCYLNMPTINKTYLILSYLILSYPLKAIITLLLMPFEILTRLFREIWGIALKKNWFCSH
jgi:hypothetical protein